jgi:hypothetical protein
MRDMELRQAERRVRGKILLLLRFTEMQTNAGRSVDLVAINLARCNICNWNFNKNLALFEE